MNSKSIISEIKNFSKIVKDANYGALLTDKQHNEILSWSKCPAVVNTMQDLKTNGDIVESPDKNELLHVVDSSGKEALFNDNRKMCFPRWICHLLGIRHRCSHAVIIAPNGLIISQKRSSKKNVSPGALDIAIGGHVKGDSSFEETLFSEMNEELGIKENDTTNITEVCVYESYTTFPQKHFLSIEARKVFEVILLNGSLDKVRFIDDEVSGIFLCEENELKSILKSGEIASGLKYSMPHFFDWKKSQKRH